MTKKIDNMEIWDSVCTTDPDHTKHVGQRGGFTAIDAMYQIQEATKQFGPAGVGWGFDYELIFPPNDTVIASVTLWHGNKDQTVHQAGQKKLNQSNGPDEDAVKKAITDGLTKCLSYLGFNADVFLGKFDDSKYVEDLRREQAKKQEAENWQGPIKKTALKEHIRAIGSDLVRCTDPDELDGLINDNIDAINQCKVDLPEWWAGDGHDKKGLNGAIEEMKDKLNPLAA